MDGERRSLFAASTTSRTWRRAVDNVRSAANSRALCGRCKNLAVMRLPLVAVATVTAAVFVGTATAAPAAPTCSRKEARTELQRVGIATDPPLGAAQVICADLTGDGVKEMAASAATPGSAGVIGWAIFRQVRQRWVVALDRSRAYAPRLVRLGTDILEIVPIYSAGDPQCCPSAARDTIYSWNGSRFVSAFSWRQ